MVPGIQIKVGKFCPWNNPPSVANAIESGSKL